MAKVSLRPRQYKRLGRLAAKNPERAERVAGRMVERDTRKERGQEFIEANKKKLVPPTPTMKTGGGIKKAQRGAGVPKGYVRGEMTGKLIPEKEQLEWEKSDARTLDAIKREREAKMKAPAKKPVSVPKKKMKNGGSFGMLSVKAGIDKNPKPTQADRIAGAKMKASKSMKKGGKVSKKK